MYFFPSLVMAERKMKSGLCDVAGAKKREVLALEAKYGVIKCHEKDDRPKAVSDALGFPWLTVLTILKGKEKILEQLYVRPYINCNVIVKQFDGVRS
jgi:hypothetical protein